MFFIYGDVKLSGFAISGGTGVDFLTSTDALNDFHDGLICSMMWNEDSQSSSSHVDVAFNTSVDHIGGVGVSNVQGLPEGCLMELFQGSTSLGQQRLRYNHGGQLGAWWLPQDTSHTAFKVRAYNDVGGSQAFDSGILFGYGEIICGHALYLPTMLKRTPGSTPTDTTAFTTTEAGSVFPTFRTPEDGPIATLGTFSTADVNTSFYSSIDDGKGGKVSLRRLRDIFLKAEGMAICDVPSAGQGAGIQHGNFRYDQEFMQECWQLARIAPPGGTISMDQPPRYSWSTNWRQSI